MIIVIVGFIIIIEQIIIMTGYEIGFSLLNMLIIFIRNKQWQARLLMDLFRGVCL